MNDALKQFGCDDYPSHRSHKKGVYTMNQNKYAAMMQDGNALIDILQSIPENKRPILAMMAEAFINGMLTQEQLTKRALEHPEPAPAQ